MMNTHRNDKNRPATIDSDSPARNDQGLWITEAKSSADAAYTLLATRGLRQSDAPLSRVATEEPDSDRIAATVIDDRRVEQVRVAFSQLPSDVKDVILLSLVRGYSYSQIASRLQISQGSVARLYATGYKLLLETLTLDPIPKPDNPLSLRLDLSPEAIDPKAIKTLTLTGPDDRPIYRHTEHEKPLASTSEPCHKQAMAPRHPHPGKDNDQMQRQRALVESVPLNVPLSGTYYRPAMEWFGETGELPLDTTDPNRRTFEMFLAEFVCLTDRSRIYEWKNSFGKFYRTITPVQGQSLETQEPLDDTDELRLLRRDMETISSAINRYLDEIDPPNVNASPWTWRVISPDNGHDDPDQSPSGPALGILVTTFIRWLQSAFPPAPPAVNVCTPHARVDNPQHYPLQHSLRSRIVPCQKPTFAPNDHSLRKNS